MPVYFVTGKLGSGKSLVTVGKIRDYLNQGRMVATNLDIYQEHLVNPWAKNTRVFRLPDKPVLSDFEGLPEPYSGEYSEDKSGLVVLDECGTWFNSRNFRDKERLPVIDYLLHIRKKGWDVMFIVQNAKMIDSQVREGLGELVVYCSRFDRLGLPLIGPLFRFIGLPIKPPKIHLGLVRYGTEHHAPIAEKWIYSGTNLYDAYDTRQVFGASDFGLHCVLPPFYTYGQFVTRRKHEFRSFVITCARMVNRLSKATILFFLIGLLVGWLFLSSDEPDKTESTGIAGSIMGVVSPIKEAHADETESDEQENYNPLRGLYITASILSSETGYEYLFRNEYGQSVQPSSLGLKVKGIKDCLAFINSANLSKQVTCSPPSSEEVASSRKTGSEYLSALSASF